MKSVLSRLLAFLPLCACLSGLASEANAATIIRVPADQPTIQAAIRAASDGDTVQVAAGTYVENLDFLGKAIRVTSEQGPDVTIIDGNQAGSVVTLASGEGRQSVLNGFTVRNGNATVSYEGGGIRIANSSPTITGSFISNNSAGNAGGGIAVSFGSPLIQGNVIKYNRQTLGFSGGVGGGGIAIVGSASAQVLNNDISNNSWSSSSGGGVSLFAAGTPTIQNNVVSYNTAYSQGGGFYIVNQSDAAITQNLIIGNSAGTGGGVYWSVPSGARGPILVNNTIYGNSGAQGSGVFADGFDAQAQLINNIMVASAGQTAVICGNFDSSVPAFRTNDVVSISGMPYGGICASQAGLNGDISADPLFVNPSAGDFHLRGGSPAIDAGTSTAAPQTDLDGTTRSLDGDGDGVASADMGVYEAPILDLAPPVTVATAAPSTGVGGWNTTNVTVTLNATDNAAGSGAKNISYSLTGAVQSSAVVAGTSATIAINAEGITDISYFAADNAGNVEAAKFQTIKIDRTAPVTQASATPSSSVAGWNATNVAVDLTAVDNGGGSGVQSVSYSINGTPVVVAGNTTALSITAEGSTVVSYAATDVAGNVEAAKSLTIKIDTSAPVIDGMPAPRCTLSPPKHQMVQVASVTASDALSGLASLVVTATSSEPESGTGGGDVPGDIVINGGTVLLRAERSPSGKGRIYTIVATAADLVGNTTTVTSTCTVPK